MTNQRSSVTTEALVLLIGVQHGIERKQSKWTVQLSRPGRDGSLTKTWEAPSGLLSADQVEDMQAWVASSVHNALLIWGGIQEVLPT